MKTKMIFINVMIGNNIDDSNRNELFMYDDNNTDIKNNLSAIIDLYVNLSPFSEEFIISINEIIPIKL